MLVVKNQPANVADTGLIPGSGRAPGVEDGNLLQVFLLENPTDICAWQTAVHGATESRTQRETEQAPLLLTMQCIISSELTQFTRESLYPLTNVYPPPLPTPE